MIWDDFYERYSDWSETTLKTRITELESIGSGEDVVDVCLGICDEKIKAQLIRKAMKLGVRFTHDDFMNLDGELPDDLFEKVANYAGFYAANPYFDEHSFDWDDFYAECADLPEDMVLRCIPRIQKFGNSDDVVDAILSVFSPADDELYNRALKCGVKFTQEQLELMGREEVFFVEELDAFNNLSGKQINDFAEHIRVVENRIDGNMEKIQTPKEQKQSAAKSLGLGGVIGFFKSLFCGGKKKHSGRCDGNCANCPAHYGYRHGRWYYGHGHNYGCEFGGNKGGGGAD